VGAVIRSKLDRLWPYATLMALFITLSTASPHFLTMQNLSSVARQTAVINIIALGMTLVIISGGIDLSVGALVGFCSILGATALAKGMGVPASLAAAAGCGLLWGGVSGLLIVVLGISPFIVTLGMMGVVRGLTLVVSRGLPVVGIPQGFERVGEGNIGPLPVPLVMLAVAAVMMHLLLERTKLGRYAYAMGSNREAARYAGVPLNACTIAIYAMLGMLTGLASMIETSRLMTGQPTAGDGYELRAIAAVVIGGGSLNGGEGTVTGTLVGAFIMGLLANGANLLGVSSFWQQVLIGAVIIVAVGLDGWRKKRT
jgi:ribose transport system permease protein